MSTFRAIYSLDGGAIPVHGYGIASGENFDPGDVVAWDSSGVLTEPAGDANDVLGYSLETVSSGSAQAVASDTAMVVPFIKDTVYAVSEPAQSSPSPAESDIGGQRDLDLSGGDWGIHTSSTGTASTPQFKIIDVDTVRNEWHVVVDPDSVTAFQWYDVDT